MDRVYEHTLLRTIRDAVNGITGLEVHLLKKSKFFRLYLDAPLGSEIDCRIETIITQNVLEYIFRLFPALATSDMIRQTICTVFGYVSDRLNRVKLFHLYKRGVISEAEYIYERNRSYAATLVTMVKNLKGVALKTLSVLISEKYPMVSSVVLRLAGLLEEKLNLSPERAFRLVEWTTNVIKSAVNTVEDLYLSGKHWIKAQFEKLKKRFGGEKKESEQEYEHESERDTEYE